jgi:hypothetical protein
MTEGKIIINFFFGVFGGGGGEDVQGTKNLREI